jgi:hypothetical protein
VAELVDALVSGTSGAIRGGSSPLLGTNFSLSVLFSLNLAKRKELNSFLLGVSSEASADTPACIVVLRLAKTKQA